MNLIQAKLREFYEQQFRNGLRIRNGKKSVLLQELRSGSWHTVAKFDKALEALAKISIVQLAALRTQDEMMKLEQTGETAAGGSNSFPSAHAPIGPSVPTPVGQADQAKVKQTMTNGQPAPSVNHANPALADFLGN